jgi:uncharacterized protein YggE
MSEPSSGLLSVRGEARVTVAPDFGVFNGALKAVGETKAEAVQSAAAGLRQLTDTLSWLGGVPLGVDSRRRPLTWSAYSATTESEHADDQSTGKWQLTGRTVATTTVQLVVRDFDVIDRLGGALAAHDGFSVHYVHWDADPDNPAWPEVRASAIRAALAKGRDYAAAVGGSLLRIEHIADIGLLGGEGPMRAIPLSAAARSAGLPDVPSLDPVPQELVAVIDARFVAALPAL